MGVLIEIFEQQKLQMISTKPGQGYMGVQLQLIWVWLVPIRWLKVLIQKVLSTEVRHALNIILLVVKLDKHETKNNKKV